MQTKLATRQFLCDLPLGDRITPRYILSVRPSVRSSVCPVPIVMWPTTCGHIMKRCGCLSVRLSVTCHISKTEPDRAIVTMDHYIDVGCN